MAIVQTDFILPQAVISNGLTTGNGFSNPNNLLLVDGETADSNLAQASDVIVGNFNFNIPEGSVITGIEMKVIGYSGAPASPSITLTPYAVDNTSGTNLYYPYTPPLSDFTTEMATYDLGTSTYLFNTEWTVDQINNFKLQLVANGTLFIDAVLVSVLYYETATPTPPTPSTVCIDCQSQIQAQPFSLALPVLATDTSIYVKSFNLPDGTPINTSMLGSCGGNIDIVLDQGRPKGNGQPFEENARIIDIVPQPNGTVKLDFVTIQNRGLMFTTPYVHDSELVSEHNANAEVVISNNAPFYDKFLKKCHIGVLVSAPISVKEDGATIVDPATVLNFKGGGVTVTDDGLGGADITIPGFSVAPPVVVGGGSGTSGGTLVSSLTFAVPCSGVNRGLLVQISTQQNVTVSSVTYNGVSLSQEVSETFLAHNLRSEQWFLVAPAVGTHNVVITLSGPAYISAGAEALVSVNQADAVGNSGVGSGTSSAPATSLTTSVDNSTIFDSLVTNDAPIIYSVGAGSVLNWSQTAVTTLFQGASAFSLSGSSPDFVTMTYTLSKVTNHASTILEIKGISPSVGTVESVTGQQVNNSDPANPIILGKVDVTSADTTANYLQNKITVGSSDASITVVATVQNPGANEVLHFDLTGGGGGGGGGTPLFIDQTPSDGTYGLLVGSVDGMNTTFTVAQGIYTTGKLAVYLNGLIQLQGASDDWTETDPSTGVFDFVIAPSVGDIITVEYTTTSSVVQNGIQFDDETGTPLGAPGTVDEFEITGGGVLGTRVANKVTYTLPGSGPAGSKTINADENVTNYFAHQLDLTPAGSGAIYSNGYQVVSNTGAYAISLATGIVGTESGGDFQLLLWNGIKTVTLQDTFMVDVGASGSTTGATVGFGFTDTAAAFDLTTNARKIGIMADSTGVLFGVTSDNSATTATSLGVAYTVKKAHRCAIVFNPVTPSVQFWVDGVLKATNTTHIPATTNGMRALVSAGINGSGTCEGFFTKPILSELI